MVEDHALIEVTIPEEDVLFLLLLVVMLVLVLVFVWVILIFNHILRVKFELRVLHFVDRSWFLLLLSSACHDVSGKLTSKLKSIGRVTTLLFLCSRCSGSGGLSSRK